MFTINDKDLLKATIKNDMMYPQIDLNNGGSPKDQIEYAIRMCVESAIDAIVDKLYTTGEFEKDLGID